MKPFLLLSLLGLYPLFGFAQTFGDRMVIELVTDRETVVFRPGPCGFYDSNTDYSLTKTICGTAAWARTVQGDSIGCDFMPAQSLNGKIAIIRRGVCEGGTKMLYAERAGAVAAIVLNHYKYAGEDLCTAPANPCCEFFFLRIPGFHASRYMSEIITAALDRGKATICLRRYRMTDAAGAYQGRTPVQQRDTLKHIQVRYSNYSYVTAKNLVFHADIWPPYGTPVRLTQPIDSVAAYSQVLINFPPYLPPGIEGVYTIRYTHNQPAPEWTDTVFTNFTLTDCDFAGHNGRIREEGVRPALLSSSPDTPAPAVEIGDIYRTGRWPTPATGVAFTLKNAPFLVLPHKKTELSLQFLLYDADTDDDGECDKNILDSVQNGFTSFTEGIIASAIYTVTGHERADELLYAPLENIIDPGQYALLKPRHFYYLSVSYMNEESDPGEPVFSAAVRAQFPAIRQWYAPVLYTSREGTKVHTGRTPFPVLHLLNRPDDHCFRKLLQTRLPHASASLEVYPNPSDAAVSIVLSDHLTEAVRLSVISSAGRVMRRQVLPFAPDGRHDLDLSALPSGVYFLMIHDEKGRLCARAPLVRLP